MFSNLQEIKGQIDTIIESDNQIDSTDKEMWKNVFSSLAHYQNEKFQEIANKLEKSLDIAKPDWRIYTGLVKRDISIKNTGWNYVLDEDRENNCICCNEDGKIVNVKETNRVIIAKGYLNAEIDEVQELTGHEKKYIGVLNRNGMEIEFKYSLLLNNSFLEEELKIYDLAEFYAVDKPVIFSPMFRRYLYVCADGIENGDIIKTLQLDKNGLESKLLLNYRSVWNIKTESETPDCNWRNPVKDINGNIIEEIFHKYVLDTDEYIYIPSQLINKLRVEKGNDFVSLCEIPDFNTTQMEKYTIEKQIDFKCIEKEFVFANPTVSISGNNLPCRIYSRVDIDKILNEFNKEWKLILKEISINKNEGCSIKNYPLHFQYFERNKDFMLDSKKLIFLVFESSTKKYYYDQIIVVINYFNRYYSEFTWKGGIYDGKYLEKV